jgi:hypothetical protein
MAISRMQQPRQNYGLGSFVKKLTRKVTKPFTKVASKIVPKEIAGIMRTAAPFLPPGYREAAYLLGTAKQTGRVSPVDLALTFAPQIGKIPTGGGYSLSDRIGNIKIPFTQRPGANEGVNKTLSNILVGGKEPYKIGDSDTFEGFREYEGIIGSGGKKFEIGSDDVGIFDTKAGQKLFGTYNKKTGSYDPSFLKIGSLGLGAADYINTQKQLEKLNEGASQVVDESVPGGGITDSEAYDEFVERLALLNPESFRVPEQFRLQSGGRVGFRGGGMDMGNAANQAQSAAMGNTTSSSSKSSNTGGGNLGGGGGGQDSQYRQYRPSTPANVTVTTPTITNDNDGDTNTTSLVDRTFTKDNLKKVGMNTVKNLAFKKFMNIAGLGQFTNPIGIAFALKSAYDAYNQPKDDALALGLITDEQKNLIDNQVKMGNLTGAFDRDATFNAAKMFDDKGSDGFLGFGKKEAEPMTRQEFDQYLVQQGLAEGGLTRTNYAMGSDDEPKPLPNDPTEPVNPFRPKPIGPFPSKMADMKSYSDYYKNLDLEEALRTFRMLKERDPEDMEELIQFFKDRKINAADGGLMRENFALGTRPTDQESGLGGLPIEADMRYTGGFMPYGAVEKADDVPARLSKNEFVFTADAVRAAGGGSVQQGAKKMYDTMKQLEQQPEAKGAMA